MSFTQADDFRLVERCQKGDRSALDDLVRRYQARAYQFAYRLTSDPDLAGDLTAEAFVRAYVNIHRFRQEAQFSTWLFRILTNCFLDIKKKEKLRQHQSIEELIQTEEGGVSRQFESSDDTPVEVAEKKERNKVMAEAVRRLPDYQRAMILMYHVEMLSYEQIAEALDMPIGTVKSRLNRARLALREILEPVEELFQA